MDIVSHNKEQVDAETIKPLLEKQIIDGGDLYEATVKEQLAVLEQLMQFEYGRWLLVNRGLNAYWYRYYHTFSIFGHYPQMTHPLEEIMFKKSPGVTASYEQQFIQAEQLKNYIQSGMCVASVPCGYMDHILRLDLSDKQNIKFVGVDLDPAAIEGAKENAKSLDKEDCCEFMVKDAWDLGIKNQFDILVSNYLNVFATTEEILLKLYENLYNAIKPNGYLVVSAMTAPLDENGQIYWNMDGVDKNDLKYQKLIYFNVIKVRQGLLCTERDTISQLKKVGFREIRIFYDSRRMFLTLIALK